MQYTKEDLVPGFTFNNGDSEYTIIIVYDDSTIILNNSTSIRVSVALYWLNRKEKPKWTVISKPSKQIVYQTF
jgi:hypothetical protein